MSVLTPFSISADTAACSTEIITGRNNSQYCMPENIYNKGTESDKAKYRLMIRSGNVGANDSQWMEDWVVNRDNLRSAAMEKDLKGVVSNYADRLKLYFKGVTNGTIHRQNSAILNYLLGSITGNQQNTNVWQAELNSLQQSNNRNYYTQSSGNNVYNTGDTNYYSFYNPDNRTFLYNNTFYDITYNTYNFYTYESYYYSTNYTFNYAFNIDNSVVNVLDPNTSDILATSTYYFKLPDGRNSYNLTQEEIYGLKTDLNILNYDVVNSSGILKGLYHFDGNQFNSAYDNSNLFSIEPRTITYLNSGNFGQALYIGKTSSNDPNIITINGDYNQTIDFRVFIPSGKTFNFEIDSQMKDSSFINYKFNKKQKAVNTTQVIKQDTSNSSYVIGNYNRTATVKVGSSISSPSCGTGTLINFNTFYGVAYQTQGTGSSKISVQDVNQTWSCRIPISSKGSIDTRSSITTYIDSYEDSKWLNNWLREGEWNHIALYGTADNVSPAYKVYINGRVFADGILTNNYNLILKFSSDQYFLFDELRITEGDIFDSNIFNNNSIIVPSIPYDSNLVYVLPQNAKSGDLLIQSNINVNNFQVGGVRSSNPEKGDVFILVNDVGFMQSLQQFDGGNWVEKKGAIFNGNLGLWVSYYGYSIYTRNWDYTALSELSVDDIETQKDFYSWLGAQFRKIRDSIDGLVINIDNSVNNNKNDDLIQNITNDNDVDVNTNITNIIGNLKNRDNDIDLTGNNFNLKNGSDLNAFTPLVKETIDVFNDNGLGFLLLLPLLIAILGLVL